MSISQKMLKCKGWNKLKDEKGSLVEKTEYNKKPIYKLTVKKVTY